MPKSLRGAIVMSIVANVLALAVPAMTSALENKESIAIDLPTQPLADALRVLGKRTATNILIDPKLVKDIQAPAIKGTLTAEQALTHLLAGTTLGYRFIDERTIVLKSADAPAAAEINKTSLNQENRNGERREPGTMHLAQAEGQTEAMSKVQDASAQPTDSPGTGLQEIVVTAQKRAENVQDVPMSITAITADDIDRRGLVNAADYLRGIPGVSQVESGFNGQSIIIRGIETSPSYQNFGSGTTTATYFGETPTTNTGGLGISTNIDLKLVDIERIEVLRGPQGTAFGNSSMGGTVRTIPVAPKLNRVEGKVQAGYSVTSGTGDDNYNAYAIGNLPLVQDKLAIRATAYKYEDSGIYRNRAGTNAAFQAGIVTPFGADAFARDEDEVGAMTTVGGRVAALFQATDNLRVTLNYLSQKSETDGVALATMGTFDHTLLQVAQEHVVRGQDGGLSDADIAIANAVVEYNFGWADLTATYSHTKSSTITSLPFGSFNLNWPASYLVDSDHTENVSEIRLATKFDSPWNFLAGVYVHALKDEGVYDYRWHGGPVPGLWGTTGAFLGSDPVIGSIPYVRRDLKQKAAFGEVSWELLPALTLTGGIRVYEYDRSGRSSSSGALLGESASSRSAGDDTSGQTFRANLSYNFDGSALVYAGWSQGFRFGSGNRSDDPTAGVPAGRCDQDGDGIIDGTTIPIASTRTVKSDTVDNYEIGAKALLLGRRLLVAADIFRMDWADIPAFSYAGSLSSGSCGVSYLTNAGKARSEGVELQASFQVSEPFRVDVGSSWIHARLMEDVPAQEGWFDGNSLPGSPEVNANLGLQYEFEIGGHKAHVRTDSIYVGHFYGNLREIPNPRAGGYIKHDASARMQFSNLSIDLFVRNLTNEDDFSFRGVDPFLGPFFGYRLRPRTIGAQLSYTF